MLAAVVSPLRFQRDHQPGVGGEGGEGKNDADDERNEDFGQGETGGPLS